MMDRPELAVVYDTAALGKEPYFKGFRVYGLNPRP
jgi:hypothetical protein